MNCYDITYFCNFSDQNVLFFLPAMLVQCDTHASVDFFGGEGEVGRRVHFFYINIEDFN